MRPEELEDLLHLRTFVPFSVHLSDGTMYEVRHPDQVRLTRSAIHIMITRDEQGQPVNRLVRYALIHINRLETTEPIA